jgi:hypothetical protein
MKIFGMTRFRGNDFATIKKSSTKKYLSKIFKGTRFRGNDFATIKKFCRKFLLGHVFEEMILRQFKNFRPKNLG